MTHFLDTLSASVELTSQERDVLIQTGVTSHEDLHSLTVAFPESLKRAGVRVQLLSSISTHHVEPSYATQIAVSDVTPLPPFGATPPSDPWWDVNSQVAAESATTIDEALTLRRSQPIDLRKGIDWPVRNQAYRGTCVAFAVTAAVERLQSGPQATPRDLSEQFLYWGMKEKGADWGRNSDGSSIGLACYALADYGICGERDWPYNPEFIPGHAGQPGNGNPSYTALAQGKRNRMTGSPKSFYGLTGSAAMALAMLQIGRPVAIALPTFSDSASSMYSSWSTPVARAYGRILNPPPTARRSGPGHAVCIVGFQPDPYEPLGGYFIFRNSWGTGWASRAPATGHSYAPAPGYGDVSATFVDKYNWQMLAFES